MFMSLMFMSLMFMSLLNAPTKFMLKPKPSKTCADRLGSGVVQDLLAILAV